MDNNKTEENMDDSSATPRLLTSLNPAPGSFKPRNRLLSMRPKRNSLFCVKKPSDSNFVQPLKATETVVCTSQSISSPDPTDSSTHTNTSKSTQPIKQFIKRFSVHFSQPQLERQRDSNSELQTVKRSSSRFSFNSWRRRRSLLAHDSSVLSNTRDRSPLKTRIAMEEQLTLYQTSDLSTDESSSHASLRSDTSSPLMERLRQTGDVVNTDVGRFKRSGKRRSLWNSSQSSSVIGSQANGTITSDTSSSRSSPRSSSVSSLCPDSSEQLFLLAAAADPNLTPKPTTTPYPCKRKYTMRSRYVQRKRRSTLCPDGITKQESVNLGNGLDSTQTQPVQPSSDAKHTLRANEPFSLSLPASDVSRSTSPAPSMKTGSRSPSAHQLPVRRDIRGRRLTVPNPFLASSPALCVRCPHSSLDLNISSTWTLDKPQGQDSGLSSEVSTSSAQTAESADFTTEHEEEEEAEDDDESVQIDPHPSPPLTQKYAIGRGSVVKSTTTEWSNRLRQSLNRAGRKCRLLAGRTLFNRNPKEGMQYLLEHGLIPRVPVAIARFLLNETELCRQAIGEYFGTLTDNLASEVLREYLQMLELNGLQLDEALRIVLSHFHPVGESQKISHLMQMFQETYTAQNSQLVAAQFRSSETIEILAYSILLLHTDLHNPNVRRLGKRMTKEEFVNNNRGIDAGEDLPADMLQAIYDRVAATQFKTIPDPFDRLRGLDPLLTGPLKTDNFLQRHRRFVGWMAAHQLDNIVVSRRSPKRPHGRWRHLLIFNDILIVTKPVASGSLLNLTAAVAMGESASVRNAAALRRKSLPADRIVEHRLRPHPQNKSLDTAGKVYHSTDPMTTGTYYVRLVLPLIDLRVLVFESHYHQFGVQLCNNTGPLLNLNLVSSAARQTLIDWLHGSIAEMAELRRYHQSKTEPKPAAMERQTSEPADGDSHAVEFQTRL